MGCTKSKFRVSKGVVLGLGCGRSREPGAARASHLAGTERENQNADSGATEALNEQIAMFGIRRPQNTTPLNQLL
jgi:hypothetical protein